MSKFEVGQKVRVVKNWDCVFSWVPEMDEYVNMTVTIKTINESSRGDKYRIEEDNSSFIWDENCFVEAKGETMETIMKHESDFSLTEEKIEAWTEQAEELLHEYDYDTTPEALRDIFTEWARQKGWLIDLFRKSEYYNGNGQIIIPANLKRPINKEDTRKFYAWATMEYRKMVAKREIMIGLHTYADYKAAYERTYKTWDRLPGNSIYNGMTAGQWGNEYVRMKHVLSKANEKYSPCSMDYKNGSCFVSQKDWDKVSNFEYMLDLAVYNASTNILDEDKVERINKLCEANELKARAIVGQKVTKFVGKLLKELGMNHIVDRQTQEWVDANGEVRTREKDMGYNYYFALLGDAINPLEYEREVVISVNPFDYWTMSFGYKWASCHTVDKKNDRGNGSDNYSGCYSGGTESYMLDPSSIIVYVRPSEEEIKSVCESEEPIEFQSKLKRCVFYLGEDKLAQSRVYPDGRDGGDDGLAAQLRAIMQKQISELYDTPNMWTLKKGTSNCLEAIRTVASVHYPDYSHYDDCNVSYLRRINGDLNYNKIEVGSSIICPNCGDRHYTSEHITCNRCFDDDRMICDHCGDEVNEWNCINIGDEIYCCSECAEEAGYRYAEDSEEWMERDRLYYDDWCENYWEDYYGYGVTTADGTWYHNEETAEEAGYRYSEEESEWYPSEDVYEDVNGTTFYMPDYPDAVETEDGWYMSAGEAEDNGWELNEDGEYVRAA